MSKELKARFGTNEAPLTGINRVLVKESDHDFGGKTLTSLIAINEAAGTYTGVNVYSKGGKQEVGKGYDPENYTRPLSEMNEKKLTKKGYVEGNVGDWVILGEVGVEVEEVEEVEESEVM